MFAGDQQQIDQPIDTVLDVLNWQIEFGGCGLVELLIGALFHVARGQLAKIAHHYTKSGVLGIFSACDRSYLTRAALAAAGGAPCGRLPKKSTFSYYLNILSNFRG